VHERRIVHCTGPGDAHAFDGIALQPRRGQLDAKCPKCCGHGQWNGQLDLNSHRSIRVICDRCDGHGWIETGDDMVASPDVVISPEGYPQWVEKLSPPGEG
jgi:hypothetical protein